ncbi:TIGR01621 family pseudouridine synthase [Thalassotalea profundi]|uniref:RNA pseudouridine synthase n=1 Tax=Thalassotalea profundi TaxID=2036687 RepID=A0ABQ3IEN3_9GAMM|nr:TIGR01621 family pseudouridine synthase [Thalassotalea profundi]GHE81718.1 RNA pseudouridine synthase [Thalassotalea profundi]
MTINNSPIILNVLENNVNFIVVNKPDNFNFHDEALLGEGLFNQVKEQMQLSTLYPVHRLDKMTSGLIIFAKNLACAQWFQQQFEQHTIDKYYIALSDKKPKKKQGQIKGDMVKSRRGTWKLMRSQNNPAITQFFSFGLRNKTRLFILKPHTGKTHQLRVALSSLGSPIIGDTYYHSSVALERGYLHAYALKFIYDGEQFEFISRPESGELFNTTEFIKMLNEIGKPWSLKWPRI